MCRRNADIIPYHAPITPGGVVTPPSRRSPAIASALSPEVVVGTSPNGPDRLYAGSNCLDTVSEKVLTVIPGSSTLAASLLISEYP